MVKLYFGDYIVFGTELSEEIQHELFSNGEYGPTGDLDAWVYVAETETDAESLEIMFKMTSQDFEKYTVGSQMVYVVH